MDPSLWVWNRQIHLTVVLSIVLLAACTSSADTLMGRLTAANLLAASAAQGLAAATSAQEIRADSETATTILLTLDAVELSLDSAGSAMRAGLPEMALRNLDAAESQLDALSPMLPRIGGSE